MASMTYYTFDTAAGTLSIVPASEGYTVMFKGAELGNFDSPEAAVAALTSGALESPSKKHPLDSLKIPTSINQWEATDITGL